MIVFDADVLGRRRTGDETYVLNLLRELGRIRGDRRIVALTRHPELVPDGIEPYRLTARSQELRMALAVPRALRRLRPDLVHFQHVLPPYLGAPAVLTVHDLSFERDPTVMGRATGSSFARSCRARCAAPNACLPCPSGRSATLSSSTTRRPTRSS